MENFIYVLFPNPRDRLFALTRLSKWRDRKFMDRSFKSRLLLWIIRPIIRPIHHLRDVAAREIMEARMNRPDRPVNTNLGKDDKKGSACWNIEGVDNGIR